MLSLSSFSQKWEPAGDKTREFGRSNIASFDTQPDSTVYSAMQQLLNANLPLSYVSLPMIGMGVKPIERVGNLVLGEGQKGYILEAVTDMNFILNQGRRQSPHWQQTYRLAFKYAPGVRMTQDNSRNLIPTNQKVGIQIDKVLWDDYTRIFFTESSGKTAEQENRNFFADTRPLKSLTFTFIAMHYSNGQPAGVYRSIDSARNDYIKGDFSTNVLNPSFTYNYFNRRKQLLSANLGYQRDSEWGGPFAFIPEQKYRYGQNRITGYLQWRTQPVNNIIGITRNVRGRDGKDYKIKLMWEYRFRFDYEYILGNLDLFKRSKDYRFNWHIYAEGHPLRSRSLGYFLHLYRGRDYFNIRYDDIVWVAQAGFSFAINLYQNPRFHPDDAIIQRAQQPPQFFQKQEEKRNKKR